MTNPAASWLSPRTRVGPSAIEGRGLVTGKDWQKPELQERYGSFMSSYLQEKIARSRTIRSPR